jgi:hypothetical protein
MLRTSFNAQMISGRQALRSSAALRAWQTRTINEFEVLLSSLEGVPLDELPPTVRKFTILRENVPKNPRMLGMLWSEATASFQDLEDALQMFSGECSGPH